MVHQLTNTKICKMIDDEGFLFVVSIFLVKNNTYIEVLLKVLNGTVKKNALERCSQKGLYKFDLVTNWQLSTNHLFH